MRLLFMLLFNFSSLFDYYTISAHKSIEPRVSLSANGFPFAVEFSTPITLSFEAFQEKYLIIDSKISYDKIPHRQSRTDVAHEKYVQRYDGIPIEGSGYNLHYREGKVYFINGHYTHITDLNTRPRLTEIDAKNAFCRSVSIQLDSIISYDAELLIREFEIVNGADFVPILVYKVSIRSLSFKNGSIAGYLDAQTGKLLGIIPENHLIAHENTFNRKLSRPLSQPQKKGLRKNASLVNPPATGTFSTRYSGTRYSSTGFYNGAYHLSDSTRQSVIWTRSMENTTGYHHEPAKIEITDNDNIWTTAEHAGDTTDMGLDVHWALQEIYDHLYKGISINSKLCKLTKNDYF